MKVITLCGSTKFKNTFREMEKKLTLEGHAVISLGFFEQSEGIEITPEQEAMFEKIHRRKIDIADEIYVIDVDRYIGKSTAAEIEYAQNQGKAVHYYSIEN
ncbi:hypothetical protein CR205_12435 [Alteribacter lacisalsi]|uniref:DUF4406 domain-containing protein n=1 Tax=Alteribacter lacisalsi TaxID=2045244 RepID=A0A2W0H5X8_9BACI|nr:DUF4406 domain-containing protein [Alteribacter lacisalsi]PYZ96517.1 hypothetical protein CR205_12435 [Alteribacter lacisalsi]